MPVSRGEAPVAMMTVFARMMRSPQKSWRGVEVKSTLSTRADSNRVPKRVACSRMFWVS
jgi:hypothetical protein